MNKKIFIFLTVSLTFSTIFGQPNEARLMRFPTINGNQIVFSYAGDLYSVATNGGTAQKLTNHVGYEMFAKISPDGQKIAFTAQYDGNTEVYTMPAQGGEPIRLTYTATLSRDDVSDRMGPNNIVMCWTPDSKFIVYRSRCYTYNDFTGKLFKISVEGGMPEEMPISDGGFCSFSPDGQKLAFNWIFREFRTWKYYKGGMADDIRILDLKTDKTEKITKTDAQEIFPMWIGDNIYFLSDRDRAMNLFSYNTNTKEEKKLTDFKDYDIKFPSAGGDKIVFENAGYIYVFDTKTQKSEKVKIYINEDFPLSRPVLTDVSKSLSNVRISPRGERILASAHGDIFSISEKDDGLTRNLTHSSDANDRNPEWSPDGKTIAFISDKSGEFEIWTQVSDGSQPAVQLTKNADTYMFRLKWSPDSKKIVWSDKKLRLRCIDVDTKKITEIDQSDVWEFNEYTWSPDGKFLAYTLPQITGMNKILVYEFDDKSKHEITDEWFDCRNPEFGSDGKFLFFTSERSFNPEYNTAEWNISYSNTQKIYFIPLQKDTKSPFEPDNQEANVPVKDEPKKDDDKDKDKKNVIPVVKIDFDQINNRIIELPITAANYGNITVIGDKVYYIRYFSGENHYSLFLYDLVRKTETDLGSDMNYEISTDNKKMLISQKSKHYIIDLPTSKIELKDDIDVSNVKTTINYREEWNQIYNEAWRQMRDFFYDPNMNGVDWKKMHDKYAVLLPYVNNRDDLTYLIGEMIGELNIGHAYINSGEKPHSEKIPMGLLGAKFVHDDSGYYKITKILAGANWDKSLRSPLTEPGVDVREGDYILAVNGVSVKNSENLFQFLAGTAEKLTELTVNSKPETEGSRNVIVNPLLSEADLYYYNWVQNNIRKVSEATGGEVGYIHIPDMASNGYNKFSMLFYPQMRKKALIIDDRGNGGGNVSPIIIERLRRELSYFGIARNVKVPSFNPEQMVLGPKVLLLNQYSASDGDLFPCQFQYYKLGKTIGVRSWGGVTGIRGSLPFVDGTELRKPEFSKYSADGKTWIVEGHGVDPDIVVENDPADEFLGKDAQLDKAIEVIKEEMKNFPQKIQNHPDFPDKSK
jgi:tricorn protease